MAAAYSGNRHVCERLLERGADIHQLDRVRVPSAPPPRALAPSGALPTAPALPVPHSSALAALPPVVVSCPPLNRDFPNDALPPPARRDCHALLFRARPHRNLPVPPRQGPRRQRRQQGAQALACNSTALCPLPPPPVGP